jgi:acetolactate synthase-1/2/3 large subunit
MISMAAREAFNGAPGPAYLEIPRDILDREIDIAKAIIPQPGKYRASTKSIGDPRDIERLADLLVASERPAILYGQQVWTARGHLEAVALLRGLDIPGYFNGGSRGLLPPGDPHHFDRTRGEAFANADVIVIVGTPFDFRMGYGKCRLTWTTARSARIATSRWGWWATRARSSAQCCRRLLGGSRAHSARRGSNG